MTKYNLTPIRLVFVSLTIIFFMFTSCGHPDRFLDYPIGTTRPGSVNINDSFWAPRMRINATITIPAVIDKLYSTKRVQNFRNAALVLSGQSDGEEFCTAFTFDDSDIYKLIEAGSLSMAISGYQPGSVLDKQLDSLIRYVKEAQEDDGYLFTARTMNPDTIPAMAGAARWENEQGDSHELYNLGHLYEAACSHYTITGKRELLDIARKSADFLYRVFIEQNLVRYPGHEEIETGLTHLYRTTHDSRYLKLAQYFIDHRGPRGEAYNQAHVKPVDQREAAGHAVRLVYLMSGMTELASLTGDTTYLHAAKSVWNDITQSKTYVTGGIGSESTNEGFGKPFDLPNHTAYCETCSSIGFILWNHRMFRTTGESKYIDLMEKTLYNAFLSGISLSGDRFFYPNPLESWGKKERPDWYTCACCPPNVARLIAMVPGLQYAVDSESVYVNLFIAGSADLQIKKAEVKVVQQTLYPWDGKVDLSVDPDEESKFAIRLRIPGWARNEAFPTGLYQFTTAYEEVPVITVNGDPFTYLIEDGYAVIERTWHKGDRMVLSLPMPVRMIKADERITADVGKIAFQRGPMVYCDEAVDNGGSALTWVVEPGHGSAFTATYQDNLLKGICSIRGPGRLFTSPDTFKEDTLQLIPYCTWANRSLGEMAVWLPTAASYITRFPLPRGLEAHATAIASYAYDSSIPYLNDGIDPVSSDDRSSNAFRLHPHKGTTEWIVYQFDQLQKVTSVDVYWLQDGSYGLPASWRILYHDPDNEWIPVENTNTYMIEPDHYNKLTFKPVKTKELKLEMTLRPDLPGGIIEWKVN